MHSIPPTRARKLAGAWPHRLLLLPSVSTAASLAPALATCSRRLLSPPALDTINLQKCLLRVASMRSYNLHPIHLPSDVFSRTNTVDSFCVTVSIRIPLS